jgi:hypothetical protein
MEIAGAFVYTAVRCARKKALPLSPGADKTVIREKLNYSICLTGLGEKNTLYSA